MTDPMPDVVAKRFAVLTGSVNCFKCGAPTPVAAIAVADHREAWDAGDEGLDLVWEHCPEPALLGYIRWINPEASVALEVSAPQLRMQVSMTAGETYLGNACQACGTLQGDWFLHKPEAPFFPQSDEDADALGVQWLDVPIQAVADCGTSSWLDDLLERRGDYVVPVRPRRSKTTRA